MLIWLVDTNKKIKDVTDWLEFNSSFVGSQPTADKPADNPKVLQK